MTATDGKNRAVQGVKRVVAAVLAFAAGVVNALFGGGGGMLIVPALTWCLHVEEKRSHATAVAVMLPLSLCSAIVLTVKGLSDFSLAAWVTGGTVVGGAMGAVLMKKLPMGVLSVVFYAVMIIAGIKYLG